MKNTILYIGNFTFPLGNAAGKRVYANGKLLKELGYEVVYIGVSKELKLLKPLKESKKEYDGFTYYEFPYPNKSLDWINYKKTFSSLIKFLTDEKLLGKLGMVIYYGSPSVSIFISKVIKYCKRQEINVVADCVDWLTTKTNNPIFDIVKWADNTYQKAYLNKKADGVIAISSYLSNYYKKYGCKTVIIPPLSPVKYKMIEKSSINSDRKILSYAGLPFRKGQPVTNLNTLKDRIDKTIILLHQAKRNGCKFTFNIYGFTKDEYLQAIPDQKLYVNQLDDYIIFHGPKPNNEVVENIIKSDFTILIRDFNRDTSAGFPTKVSESISCGTPVITTKTSDLQEYIVEGENGFFVNTEIDNAALKIQEILSMNMNEIKVMKKKCLTFKGFQYENHIEKVDEFLGGVLNEKAYQYGYIQKQRKDKTTK